MSQTQTLHQTTEQRRAAQAWENIQSVDKTGYKKDYGSLVRGFAAMIQQDGLGPALAFLQAKGKDHHKALYEHLSDWVLGEMKVSPVSKESLLEWLLKQSSATYRRVAVETLAYLNWLKRFAEAKGWSDDNDHARAQ